MRLSPSVARMLALTMLLLGAAHAAEDIAALRERAIARIEQYKEHVRRTGEIASHRPQLEEASKQLLDAFRTSLASRDADGAVASLLPLAELAQMRAHWKVALDIHSRLMRLAPHVSDDSLTARLYTGMSQAARGSGDLGSASEYAAKAVAASANLDDLRLRADALSALAGVQTARNELNAAFDTARRSIDAALQSRDTRRIAAAHADIASVWARRAEACGHQTAFDDCRNALRQAITSLSEASRLAEGLGHQLLVRLYTSMKTNLEARDAITASRQSAFDARAAEGDKLFVARKPGDVVSDENFVSPFYEPSPAALAVNALVQAEADRLEKAGGFSDTVMWSIHTQRGFSARLHGRHDEALQAFQKAIGLVERERSGLRDDRQRAGFAVDKMSPFEEALVLLLHQKRYPEAFAVMERMRARAMADLLAGQKLALGREGERAQYAEAMSLRSEIAARQAELFRLATRQSAADDARVQSLVGEIRAREVSLDQLEARIARDSPHLHRLTGSLPVALAQLQQTMREERFEMLQYVVTGSLLVLWHIAPDAVNVRRVLLPRNALQPKVARLLRSLSDGRSEFDARTAQELYLFLVQPAKQWLRAPRVVIVPHHELHRVPFQALLDPDGRAFGETTAVSYAPSATVLMSTRRPPTPMMNTIFAVAEPDLPAGTAEVDAVARLFRNPSVVTGRLATKGEIRTSVEGKEVVHLTVHGKFDAVEPMQSHLVLGPAAGDDGRLTAAEMFGLPLDQTRLVVLSACESGRSAVDNAGDVQGMLRGLLHAGAANVVLSYWRVDSDATAVWMEAFHRAARSAHPAEAARAALTAVKARREYAHPYFWAAFMTVGR